MNYWGGFGGTQIYIRDNAQCFSYITCGFPLAGILDLSVMSRCFHKHTTLEKCLMLHICTENKKILA